MEAESAEDLPRQEQTDGMLLAMTEASVRQSLGTPTMVMATMGGAEDLGVLLTVKVIQGHCPRQKETNS